MNYVTKLMNEKKLTVYQLSKLSGIPKTTLHDICSGKAKLENCSGITLKKLANALECSTDELLLGKEFLTSVLIENNLKDYVKTVHDYEKRDCLKKLEDYLKSSVKDTVCVLYGLRRTGKTTMIRQVIESMNEEELKKTAYIKISEKDTIANLDHDLRKLKENGYQYVFIDEITLLSDFIDCASLFSDVYAGMGMRIVLSGTDSLSFFLASANELYDRNYTIHTTYIPFQEHSRLLGTKDIDDYIKYGGTLRMEDSLYSDSELKDDEFPFKNEITTRKYIDSAIAENIQNSLAYFKSGSRFRALEELYENGELTSAINRIIEDMNHNFTADVIKKEFFSHDLGAVRNIFMKKEGLDIHQMMDKASVLEEFIEILKIRKNEDELKVKNITQGHIEQIKDYLFALELISDIDIYSLSGNGHMEKSSSIIFTQPGMRYAQAKALVQSLMNDPVFLSQDTQKTTEICNKILDHIAGHMLEDIVVFDTAKTVGKDDKVFKLQFDAGEFDMVVYHKNTHTCDIFEIKHNPKQHKDQHRHLMNERFLKLTEEKFGPVQNKCVLYRGNADILENGIKYLNVNQYLKNLYQERDKRLNQTVSCECRINRAKEKAQKTEKKHAGKNKDYQGPFH